MDLKWMLGSTSDFDLEAVISLIDHQAWEVVTQCYWHGRGIQICMSATESIP